MAGSKETPYRGAGGGADLVGKTVETGSRNHIQNQDMMISGDIELPVKQYTFEPVGRAERDTPLDHGAAGQGSATHAGGSSKGHSQTNAAESLPNVDMHRRG